MMIRFLIIFCFVANLKGQTTKIKWQPKDKVFISKNLIPNIPSIKGENFYADDNLIPHYYTSSPIEGQLNITLSDFQYSAISKGELGDIYLGDIPDEITYKAKSVKSANKWHQIIDVTAIFRNGNNLYKITSFKINQSKKNLPPSTFRMPQGSIDPVFDQSNGSFYKISVDTTAVYKLDYKFFIDNGLPTNFDPNKLKIYGNGGMMLPEKNKDFRYKGIQENAIYAYGAEDNSFDEGDYFLFYAQGPNGIDRNKTMYYAIHSKNLYEDKAYYFIGFESAGKGKRIKKLLEANGGTNLGDFDQVLFHEKDSLNIYGMGRQWFEREFSHNNKLNINFKGNSSKISNGKLYYRFVGVNAQNNSININLNGNNIVDKNTFISGGNQSFRDKTASAEFNDTTYPLNVEINIDNSTNPAGIVYFDYIELRFKQSLDFSQKQLGFRWLEELNENQKYSFNLKGSPEFIWDVSDRTNISQLSSNSNSYTFSAKAKHFPNEFIAFNNTQALKPKLVEKIKNQSLSKLKNIDYIIVTHPDYKNIAKKLAAAHKEVSNVSTAIVTPQEIYNEFSSGSQDLTGIKDFFKYLYEQEKPLKYVLLLGNASYDYKDRIPRNTNRVPTYQGWNSVNLANSYATDDYYGMLDDTDSGLDPAQLDIAIGRIPASNVQEAEIMVNKTLSHINKNNEMGSVFGDWRTKVMFVVDDDDPGEGNAFHTVVENLSAKFLEENKKVYTLRKIYADAFKQVGTSGGVRYPAVTDAIVNGIETGTLLVNYFGHGGITGWAQERIFTFNEINKLSNYNQEYSKLPVFLTVTCDFSVWDLPQITSGGELLIKNPNGGSVAMITTSREIQTAYGKRVNDKIVKRLFEIQNNQHLPLGEALRLAKADYNLGKEGLSVNLLGDPLISLATPQRKVEIDKINGKDANSFDETVRALDFVTIEGKVLSKENSNQEDLEYNGEITGTLFDKPVERTTLNNDGVLDVLTYSEQVDAIYRGKTKVKNGKFKLEFYIPKDINFDIGNGKLLLYTHNNKEEGATYKDDIKVGGINPNGVDDDEGPAINLYMNNLNFAPGGITDRSPYLLACVTDSTGINATGAGIGHDITQLLNEDINTTTVLNQFFEGGENAPCKNPGIKDYQQGRVLYRLRDLELGEHTVKFRIWDINNNSSTATLNFVVMENGSSQLHIDKLLNWPNPFTDKTFFHFEHNCPEMLEAQIQIFTVSGKLVKNIRQSVSSAPFREGYRTGKYAIPWNGLDDYGNKIGKGVYIYKVIIKGSDSEKCKGVATKIEKLVILK